MSDKPPPVPPSQADPRIVGHVEGDRRQIERYRRACGGAP